MTLNALRFFRTIAEEGSYSAAAEKLNYAQSNLSSRIRILEEECGGPLFLRHSKGVTLTERGQVLMDYAVRVLDLADEMEGAVRDGGSVVRTLRIGSMESTAVSLLPDLLAEYRRQFPERQIVVSTGTTKTLLQALGRREIDGAFVAGEIRGDGYASIPVRDEELVLISAANSGIQSLSSLLRTTQLVFPSGCSYRRILEDLTAIEGAAPAGIVEFGSLGAIIASVSAGLGVSLFPRSVVSAYCDRKDLNCYELPESLRNVRICFVYRNSGYVSRAEQDFIRLLETWST